MIKNMLVIVSLSFMFVSCLGIEEVVTVNDDNSGTVALTYKIAKEFSDLGSYKGEKKPLALPVLRTDFERIAAVTKGLTLKSYSSSETEKDVVVRAEIGFASIEALAGLDFASDPMMKAVVNGKSTTLTIVIPKAGESEITQDTIALFDEMSSGYDIILTVHTPKPIVKQTLGEQAKDKRSATLKTNLVELLRTNKKQQFEIAW
jgi:hypothetical protein